jgi:hypothetical protein
MVLPLRIRAQLQKALHHRLAPYRRRVEQGRRTAAVGQVRSVLFHELLHRGKIVIANRAVERVARLLSAGAGQSSGTTEREERAHHLLHTFPPKEWFIRLSRKTTPGKAHAPE